MSNINDGGPAFPQHGWSKDPATIERMQAVQGLTVRDYFAAAALTAFLSTETVQQQLSDAVNDKYRHRPEEDRRHVMNEVIAKRAYWLADAMLAEKAKGGGA